MVGGVIGFECICVWLDEVPCRDEGSRNATRVFMEPVKTVHAVAEVLPNDKFVPSFELRTAGQSRSSWGQRRGLRRTS